MFFLYKSFEMNYMILYIHFDYLKKVQLKQLI
jgi:hypothetical protein